MSLLVLALLWLFVMFFSCNAILWGQCLKYFAIPWYANSHGLGPSRGLISVLIGTANTTTGVIDNAYFVMKFV